MGGFAPGFEDFSLSTATIELLKRRDEVGLHRAKRQLKLMQGMHRRRRTMSFGEMQSAMPAWYYHKLAAWGRLHGYGRNGYAVHDDPALLRDILRNNPELRYLSRSDKVGIGYGTHGSAVTGDAPVRTADGSAFKGRTAAVLEDRPNRFRKVYPNFDGKKAA